MFSDEGYNRGTKCIDVLRTTRSVAVAYLLFISHVVSAK